jgi:hypothetical protein
LYHGRGDDQCRQEQTVTFFSAKEKMVRAKSDWRCGQHDAIHSASGWMMNVTFKEYLVLLRQRHPEIPEIHIVLDVYAAHRRHEYKAPVDHLASKLYFIPAGCTYLFQPLDCCVFGALKSTGRKKVHDRLAANPEKPVTKPWGSQLLVESWERFLKSTVAAGRHIYRGDRESDDDEIDV